MNLGLFGFMRHAVTSLRRARRAAVRAEDEVMLALAHKRYYRGRKVA